MRLPDRHLSRFLLFSCIFLLGSQRSSFAQATAGNQPDQTSREATHQDLEWKLIEPHLPDPVTASASALELEGDILRARRFPVDALDYYNFALKRGGNQEILFKKLGVTELELHNESLARLYFKKSMKLHRNDPDDWNNLGAVEFLDRQYSGAISDYKHAVKLNKRNAIYHSNLGIAYFEKKDYESARKQIATAVELDPAVLQRSGFGGVSAQLLSPSDRARFCFEMARAFATMGSEDEMLHQLTLASELGYDVLYEMDKDPVFAKYRTDPRVLLIVRTANTMRAGHLTPEDVAGGATPPASMLQ